MTMTLLGYRAVLAELRSQELLRKAATTRNRRAARVARRRRGA